MIIKKPQIEPAVFGRSAVDSTVAPMMAGLSVGGPVVDPTVEALILVALAPHTLSARPLVLGANSVVRLTLETGGDAVLSGDGQTRLHLLPKDYVEIRRSQRTTNLVTIQNEDFLHKLRDRLFWSQSILGKDIEN